MVKISKIYFIGGSPCSGKSTVAEQIIKHFDFVYYKIDDYLETYMSYGARDKKPICLKQQQLSCDEIWMRDPIIQAEEEWQFYDEIFEYVMEDIQRLSKDKTIIAEGAAFKPDLMKQLGVLEENYICIIPSRDFQIEKYQQRDWIGYVIGECTNSKKAFENWMERDILFAQQIQMKCNVLGYTCLINDGTRLIAELEEEVKQHLKLV